MIVETKYALLEDGGRFLFDPAAEALPTHVDGARVVGVVAGPPVEVDIDDDTTRANWKKVRAAVAQVLAPGRPDVAPPAEVQAPPEAPPPPARYYGGGA